MLWKGTTESGIIMLEKPLHRYRSSDGRLDLHTSKETAFAGVKLKDAPWRRLAHKSFISAFWFITCKTHSADSSFHHLNRLHNSLNTIKLSSSHMHMAWTLREVWLYWVMLVSWTRWMQTLHMINSVRSRIPVLEIHVTCRRSKLVHSKLISLFKWHIFKYRGSGTS